MVYNVDTVIGLKFLLWIDEADWADGADRVDRTNETDVAEMTIRILYIRADWVLFSTLT